MRADLEYDPETGYAEDTEPRRFETPLAKSSCDALRRCSSLLVDAIRRATEYDSMNSTRAIGIQSAKKAPNSCLNSGTLMKSKPGWTNPIKKRRDEKRKRDKRKEKKRRGKKLKGKERKERK